MGSYTFDWLPTTEIYHTVDSGGSENGEGAGMNVDEGIGELGMEVDPDEGGPHAVPEDNHAVGPEASVGGIQRSGKDESHQSM